MKATKLADKIWYFEDALDDPDSIFDSLTDWFPVQNQPYMKSTIVTTSKFLDDTEEATFKCLDIWYKENSDLNNINYRLLPKTSFYERTEGLGYGPHLDFASMHDGTYETVHATILGYFSDPETYGGGAIIFPDHDVEIRPSKGSMLIFGHKVRHAVGDVTFGVRRLSSQFLVSKKTFFKYMDKDMHNLTKEDEIYLRNNAPQYEMKNGNVIANYIEDIDIDNIGRN